MRNYAQNWILILYSLVGIHIDLSWYVLSSWVTNVSVPCLWRCMQYIPYLSTLVTFVFAITVFRRYLLRHGPYLLIWTIGLLWFGLGTLSEIILSLTFSGLVLKLWYLCGAMLTAAWLGQGTLHLLVRRRGVAWALTGLLVAVSVLAAVLVLHAPLTPVTSAYRVS